MFNNIRYWFNDNSESLTQATLAIIGTANVLKGIDYMTQNLNNQGLAIAVTETIIGLGSIGYSCYSAITDKQQPA